MTRARAYETSHPWISFDLRFLQQSSPRFWMLLGEARSKCDHIRYVPLSPETAADLHRVYLAKGVNATTAIEGNTLSEQQVRERMAGQLELPISNEYLGIEVDNMIGAYNDIITESNEGREVTLTPEWLRRMNKSILAGLKVDEGVVPGEFRQHSVAAEPYVGAPWEDVPYLVDGLCKWLLKITPPDEEQRLPYAFIKAVVAHVYIEWIHPFGDGNGRLGRLAESLILINHGVPLPAAHILTSHYSDTRMEYYRQLNVASRNGGDLRDFLVYAAQGFVDGLTTAIKRLHTQQEQLMWTALVDEAFVDRHTAAAHRQRLLAIALGHHREPISRSRVWRIDEALMEAYVRRTPKTLTRDLNRLREMGFIEMSADRREIYPNLRLVRGMRPFVANDEG